MIEVREVVANLVDLLHAVTVLVSLDKALLCSELSEVVHDRIVRPLLVQRSEEVNNYGLSAANLGPDAGLD